MSATSSETELSAPTVDNGERGIIMCAAKSHGLSDAKMVKYNTASDIYKDVGSAHDVLKGLSKDSFGGLKHLGRTLVAGLAEYDEAVTYDGTIKCPKKNEDALVTRALFHDKSTIAGMNEDNLRRIMNKLVHTPGVNHPTHVLVIWTKTHPVVQKGLKLTGWATGVLLGGLVAQEIHGATGDVSAVAGSEQPTEGVPAGSEPTSG